MFNVQRFGVPTVKQKRQSYSGQVGKMRPGGATTMRAGICWFLWCRKNRKKQMQLVVRDKRRTRRIKFGREQRRGCSRICQGVMRGQRQKACQVPPRIVEVARDDEYDKGTNGREVVLKSVPHLRRSSVQISCGQFKTTLPFSHPR